MAKVFVEQPLASPGPGLLTTLYATVLHCTTLQCTALQLNIEYCSTALHITKNQKCYKQVPWSAVGKPRQ